MAVYKQMKFSVDHVLAESFKRACTDAGVSMASEISALARAGVMSGLHVKAGKLTGYDTRAKRCHHVGQIITQLESIMGGYEDAYKSNFRAWPP